jgi:tRNA (cmo5U34)-methyltransferase
MGDDILKNMFDLGAKSYDQKRADIIPNLEQIYTILVETARSKVANPNILDLGAGTGLLTEYLLKRYSQGYFTLVDISDEMLNIARKRFNKNGNFHYINGDYLNVDFKGSYDLIVSSLSIHHLEDKDKKILYSKIFDHLKEDGIFVNADQVYAPSKENEYIYQQNWLEKIELGYLTKEEKEIIISRMKHDKPASLNNNLKWLKTSGFKNVDVIYKYYNFCILYGTKE